MEDILRNFVIEILMQGITFFQLFVVIDLFLERRELQSKMIPYIFIVIGGLLIAIGGGESVTILYSMFANVIILCIVYKGEIVYKSLMIIMSFTFNVIADAAYTKILRGIFLDTLSFPEVDMIFIQMGSLMIVLSLVTMLKVSGIVKQKDKNNLLPKKDAMILIGVSVLSFVVVYLGLMIYKGELQVQHNTIFLGVIMVSTLVLNVGIILIIDRDVHTRYYKKLSEEAEKELMKQLAYYEQLEVGQKEVRALKHDMRHHLGCIQMLIEKKNEKEALSYIAELDHLVRAHDTIQTGNPIMNALLNDYVQKAKENEIVLEIEVGNLKDLPIERVDVCAIFANALENALEAIEKEVEVEKRKIKLVAKIKQGYFLFKITNPVAEDRSVKKDFLQTTKRDKIHHGYGIHNIEKAVKKYNGELHIKVEEGQFIVEGMINNQALRKTS